jgi:hypothetical protein
VAGGNSAGSVPGVVELAPVFGNGGAGLAAAAARPYPTPRVDVARTISVTPRPAFPLHVREERGALVGGASLAAGGRASLGAFSAAAAAPLNASSGSGGRSDTLLGFYGFVERWARVL